MDDLDSQDQQEELSHDDLEVLQTFHKLDLSTQDSSSPNDLTAPAYQTHQSEPDQSEDFLSEDDLLALFATEADDDITVMRLALQQLEQARRLDPHELTILKRRAHKVAGTAGAIGCASMSTISRYIESIIQLAEDGELAFQIILTALSTSIHALETTLFSLVNNGFESKNPLVELEEEYQKLQIDVHAAHTTQSSSYETKNGSSLDVSRGLESDSRALRVNASHFHQLLESAENLVELDASLERAQKQVEIALTELQFAQSRLRRIEPLLSSLTFSTSGALESLVQEAGHPSSSLVARILQEASVRSDYVPQLHNVGRPQLLIHEIELWDELEIDRFSETNVLAHAFTEAITDVALATTHVRHAFKNLSTVVAQQVIQVKSVRQEAFLLRTLPFSRLATRVQEAIELLAGQHKDLITFEVSDESVEINQDVLEKLVDPIVELIQMQIAEVLYFNRKSQQETEDGLHIACAVHATNNEIAIEISFSQPISSGMVANLQETVHPLYGSLTSQEKTNKHTTLQLRIPSSLRIIQGLLVRAANQQVLVPVSQVKRIQFHKVDIPERSTHDRNFREMLLAEGYEIYQLDTLLGLQNLKNRPENTTQTALLLELDHPGAAIVVDEVVKEVVLIMKPLPVYLCRPGITSTAFDGNGNVILVLNLPQIIQQQTLYQSLDKAEIEQEDASNSGPVTLSSKHAECHKILIADDSIFIRQSLHMNLSREGYTVVEATDGLVALDQISKESPDLLLLDIEMPHLNGYDVLSIVRSHQEHSTLKIIMLTSRSSEKHKLRASELGADAYLMKPCPHDVLLQTIKTLFGNEDQQEL